MKKKDEFVNLF